jgi:hypothetical protein
MMDVMGYLKEWWYTIGVHANDTSISATAETFAVELGLGIDFGMLQGVRDIVDICNIVSDLKTAVNNGVSASEPVPDLGDNDQRHAHNYAGGESF